MTDDEVSSQSAVSAAAVAGGEYWSCSATSRRFGRGSRAASGIGEAHPAGNRQPAGDAGVGDVEGDVSPERVAHDAQPGVGSGRAQRVDRRGDIVALGYPLVVFAARLADAAEVEPERPRGRHRRRRAIHRVDNRVVTGRRRTADVDGRSPPPQRHSAGTAMSAANETPSTVIRRTVSICTTADGTVPGVAARPSIRSSRSRCSTTACW